ncbi:MAG: M6 family metalloprotease domain-containing protein [Gammaproteobacteria bacterium]|nr:M6 family metalloprotease domain-containing protein [Gammaproteobacteria bacterium]MBU2676027.1 M6 family metalloprotease domain-containing protein [Gammaproteobacteria bacterium]NNC56916.1 M6 family metalloprotease domain-containing protein [Woeseiaceae bacterium]NNL49763.1 M6 family metalloprotease domain-containing protein [Woeseiaceae bacterium]
MKLLFSAVSRWSVCALFVLTTQQALAGPASPFSFSELQPDGSRVTLHIRGDEHFNWTEDTDGFTVVRDAGGRYVYARLGAGGLLEPTSFAVGKADPRAIGLTRRILPAPAVRAQTRRSGASPLVGEPGAAPENIAPLGNVKNMVIMIRFSDHVSRPLPSNADIDILFNAVGGDAQLAPTGSVKDVYLENSYGQMTLNSTIFGWIDLPNTEAYYANGNSGDSTLWQALRYALDVVDQTVNFSDYDTDNDGSIDAIAFIHSGYGAEWGGTDQYGATTANRIWSHRWAIQNPPWTSDEGVEVFDYHISPGVWGTSGSDVGRVGVIAHETGHFFGLPDLYDTDGNGSGIGSYGMMANSWGFDGSQLYPPHFSPWSKEILGWLTPTILSTPGSYSLQQAEFVADVLRIDNGYPQDEYLLIENRQPVGFDGSMPQGGLVIWHIDEQAGYNVQGYPGQPGWPGNGNHYRVALLQADGQYHLEKDANRGDAGDVYHGGGVTEIGSTTTPNTDAYQNGNIVVTGNTISLISAAGATMDFNFGQPPPGPSIAVADHQTIYGSVSGTYASTHTDNGVYQTITETQSGGRPSRRHDRLEHIWRFTPAGTDNRFNVGAYRTDGGDADSGFIFDWATSASGPWTQMLTVTKTSDDNGYQSYTLGTVPSTVYVRVTDNNRASGERSADSIRIDHMFFDEGVPSNDPPGPASSPLPANGATNVSVTADLSWTAGTDATSHDVYFGTSMIPPFIGNQPGSSYDPGALDADTTYYWRVDEVNGNGTTTGSNWSFTTAAPQSCSLLPIGASCTADSECCSNKCKGKSGRKTCK